MTDRHLNHLQTPLPFAALALALSSATILGAWFIELVLEIKPCHLCLIGRVPHYVGIPVLALALALSVAQRPSWMRLALIIAALVYVVGLGISVYHVGVEWKIFAGPADCTGPLDRPVAIGDFLNQLQTVKIVRCDEIAMRIFGLSLANWNAIICAGLAAMTGFGATRT